MGPPLLRRLGRLGLALLLAAPAVGAPDAPREGRAAVPLDNDSFVNNADLWLREAWARADEAEAAGDWRSAVRALQEIVEQREDRDAPGRAAPYVLSVQGMRVYEGAWLVAHHRILRGGAPALAAYAREAGPVARERLEVAVLRRSPALLEEVADRFLPLVEGRRAALMRADLALEADDPDEALGWLERLEDLEAVSAEPAQDLRPWREARLRRMALALARPARARAAEASLRAAAEDPDALLRYERVGPADRRAPDPPEEWTTTGGNAGRNALVRGLGTSWELAWIGRLPERALADVPQPGTPDRPSPWLPPRAVAAWPHAFVHDGRWITVWDLARGGPRLGEVRWTARVEVGRAPYFAPEGEARTHLGLLEGHALTLGPPEGRERLLYACVSTARPWEHGATRQDHLIALRWDGRRLEPAWQRGGWADHGVMEDVRLYGAPLLYRGRLWIAGVRQAAATRDRVEAWLFGLSPRTGEVEVATHLGSGNPVRFGRPDEAIPSSPAGAAGRVVVVTALGLAAAVDARDGRPHWIFRYDRGAVAAGRPRRLINEPDRSDRQSGFANEPPILALERCYLAPTDAEEVYCLFDRPRGAERGLLSYAAHRQTHFLHMQAEQIVGVHPGGGDASPLVVVAGKGAAPEGDVPAPMVEARTPFAAFPPPGWRSPSPTGWGAEPYGRALLTADEVFVPTRRGIVVYGVREGRVLGLVDRGALPAPIQARLEPEEVAWGNLIPVPGRGLFAVNETHAAFWRARGD